MRQQVRCDGRVVLCYWSPAGAWSRGGGRRLHGAAGPGGGGGGGVAAAGGGAGCPLAPILKVSRSSRSRRLWSLLRLGFASDRKRVGEGKRGDRVGSALIV